MLYDGSVDIEDLGPNVTEHGSSLDQESPVENFGINYPLRPKPDLDPPLPNE